LHFALIRGKVISSFPRSHIYVAAMLNALTFDVEDYFHVHAFDGVIPRDQWESIPRRVCESTRFILQLLRNHNTRATFFVLGWVADRHPELVREIAADGHELASHGYAHEAVSSLTRERFRSDVSRSLEAILSACPDAQIRGYRAPSFSINAETPWAYEVLNELGFAYDSSISPATFHDRYGMPSAPRFAHVAAGKLTEIPVSTIRLLGCNWAVAGGGYFRLMPLAITNWAVRRINREGQPVVVYLHPWEFDPDQPRVTAASLRSRIRHYVNLRHTAERLQQLLRQFRFGTIEDVLRSEASHGVAAAARESLPACP
jgi:polysaccharide deacetylase family protein (PEP-CTERM system associated)